MQAESNEESNKNNSQKEQVEAIKNQGNNAILNVFKQVFNPKEEANGGA